ncbi:3-dehydroquinate synthase [Limimonas halophila]|uniref:3-dehydroquinate synthase n=1 Tax=Limimonas halophila TaxID=1082479 RepID=A0A1G7RFA8_9PROT|nr:3-dehydroquinate synthase [Limimonas halophila]SDG08819.1 3-dehydroquinate synthase [Limimonas halophila]
MTTHSPEAVERVEVDLGSRSYPILVGPELLATGGEHIREVLDARRVFVVADETVAGLHLPAFQRGLEQAGLRHEAFVVPAGEHTKDFSHLERLVDRLLDAGAERRDVVAALGGGVVGDLAGFAAAVTLRGLAYVQVPTTLLAQVDSSVGGKTGINTRHGKNLVGAFHQPSLVLADTDVLDTLPARELRAGYAEVVKYGCINDAPFFAWLETNGLDVLEGRTAPRREAIVRSCRRKAGIVAEDETESTGARALLNLGHTFAHALEAECGYDGTLLHGEAVAIGLVLAAELSAELGVCPGADAARVRAHLAAAGLPTSPLDRPAVAWSVARLLDHMAHDKKVRDGRVTFVLMRGIGAAYLSREVPREAVAAVLGNALMAA